MSAASIEKLVALGRFDRQLALVREHWAAVRHLWLEDPDVPAARKLRSQLPEEFYVGCGMPGLANIEPTNTEVFRFAEDGRPAVIVPAYDTIPGMLDANAEQHVDHIVDLVAVDVDEPDRFWRCRGEALILGAAYCDLAAEVDAPLPVYRNPLTWLKSCGDGIVVLDWDWAPDLLLGLDLIAEDLELGERLSAALRPDIWVKDAAA